MPRARDLGIDCWRFPPGDLNALTDVPGVRVGHVSLKDGVLTGVTAVLPSSDPYLDPLPANAHVINGYGKAVGLAQVMETGLLQTPIVLTTTLCVWRAAEAVYEFVSRGREVRTLNPVVLECNDSWLNGGPCRAVEMDHVREAIENARGGVFEEGAVGAGTGMTAFGFKSGIGTASRRIGEYVVGALVLSNAGARPDMRIGGVWVGGKLEGAPSRVEAGSAVAVVATDAPVGPHELGRLAKRVTHGFARVGLSSGTGSGEFSVAFGVSRECTGVEPRVLADLFTGVVETVEESYANSLLCACSCRGAGGFAPAVPAEDLARIFGKGGKRP